MYIWYIDIYMKDGMCAYIHIYIYLDTYMDNISVCANRIFTLRLCSGVIKNPIYFNIAPSKTCLSPASNNECP